MILKVNRSATIDRIRRGYLKRNGSPKPEFEMDEDRTYLNTIIYIQEGFKSNTRVSDKMSDKESDKEKMFR